MEKNIRGTEEELLVVNQKQPDWPDQKARSENGILLVLRND